MADRFEGSKLVRAGRLSWAAIGVILLIVIVGLALGALSGILVPLVIAVILGTLLEPLALWLERRGVRPALSTLLTLVIALLVTGGLIWIVVAGLLRQVPEILSQLAAGWEAFIRWAQGLSFDPVLLDHLRSAITDYAPRAGQGVLGIVSSTLLGTIALALGTFFALFFLFFVLRDSRHFPAWLARVAHLDVAVVEEVSAITKRSLLGYFRGIALTAIITAPIFMIPLLLLRIPLLLPILILYFVLSFIPYIGAWITGAFAVLIAFGAGGPIPALIAAVSLLISNGTIQNVVSSWALGSSLKMHPVSVLLATIVGGTVAGMLGMVLGPPVLAAAKASSIAVRRREESVECAARESNPQPAD